MVLKLNFEKALGRLPAVGDFCCAIDTSYSIWQSETDISFLLALPNSVYTHDLLSPSLCLGKYSVVLGSDHQRL